MWMWPRVAMVGAFLLSSAQVASAQESSVQEEERLQHMVLVPAGEFHMGSLEDDRFAEANEKPQRVIYLADFYIDKLEVTNIEYKRFTDATGYPTPEKWRDGQYPEGADFYPVQAVSWWEANAYARWVGKRLPTEAEWEKAARGTDARRFPWGDEYDAELANSEKDYAPAASYFEGASPYGALNMAGNVAEWTASAYESYPTIDLSVPGEFGGTGSQPRVARTNEIFRPPGDKQLRQARDDYPEDHPLRRFFTLEELADQRERVYRGGSINNYVQFLRCANRQKSNPKDRWYNLGFRCAMDPPAAEQPSRGSSSAPRTTPGSGSSIRLSGAKP